MIKFKNAIESYTGSSISKVEVVQDPQVSDTYAVRGYCSDGYIQDYLLVHINSNMTIDELTNHIEECEFTTWPPKSGTLKFFL